MWSSSQQVDPPQNQVGVSNVFVDSFESLVVIVILSEEEGVLGGYSGSIVTTDCW